MTNAPDSSPSRFWQRIQGKLILLLLTLLIPILLIQAYAYYERLETRRTEELQSNLELARAAAQAFETFVNDIIHQELSIGLALTSSQSLTEEDQNRILNGSKKGNSAIWEIFWSRPDGIVIAATGPQFIGMNFEDRDYFREVVSGREWTVSDLLISRTTGRPSFTISRGIRSDTGQLLGIVVAGILPEQLDHILAIKRSKGGGHALVDRKGMLVYRYPAINPTWEQRNWLRDYPEFGVALNGNEISKAVFSPFEGKNRLVSFSPVPFIGWAASAGRTEDIAMEAITSQLIPQAVLLLLVTLAAFGVALVLSRFISMPVKRLRDHALVLGRGETNDPAAAAGPAELRELADSFNSMAEQLRSRETSLRDQREWFSVTLTSIGDAVIATDSEGQVTFLNPVAAAITGWQVEEALNQPVQNVFRIINEQTHEPAENIVDRVLREGCTIALANHTALETPDGREVPIEDSAAPIRDATGNITGAVLVFHDVTERRLTQNRLRESEERFRVMVNAIPQLAWIAEADGYIFWYNQRWYDYTGTKPEQMQGWGWQSVHNPETLPGVLERWKDSITTGKPFDMVFPLRGADGSFHEFLTLVRPLKDANGDVIRWFGTNTDITEQKRMEETQSRLAAIVESSDDAIIGKTLDGIITSWNRGAEEIFGYTADEAVGQPISVLVPYDRPDEEPVILQRISRGEDVKHHDTLRRRKDGRSIHISLTISAIRDTSGKIIGASSIARDITEHKRMEMEREITVEILKIVNRSTGMADMIKAAATFFQQQSGCEAVGIRLNEGEDFPYSEARGFPEEFVRLENSLCARDALGNVIRDSLGSPCIECMCGNVILGRVDPSKPFFTPGGSFWANDTTRLLADTSDGDRQTRTRNRCNGEGYESVALIPLRLGTECLGLIQLNDRRKGMFSAETIAIWERLADHLAVAVAKDRVDETLRMSQSRLDLALKSAHMGVWHWDIIEDRRWFDNYVCILLGIDPANFTGTADEFFNAVHPDDRTMVRKALARAIEQNGQYETEYRVVCPDTTIHYIAARGRVVRHDDGQPVRLNGIIWDITERKQMEEELRKSRDELELRVHERTAELKTYMTKLEESNQALQDFASIASHDLQEPLRKVTAFGNLLKQKYGDSLEDHGRDYLERMLNANQRMQSLLTALLEYSRLSTRTDPFVEVELTEIIHEVLSDLEVRIAKTGGEVRVGNLPVIQADPTQMRQLFQNLIGNALKFYKEGNAPIVNVSGTDRDNCHFDITIEDNGIGFEERYLEKIFAPFQRLHGKSSQYEGTGMGLAICKKIVERHGGEITARSEPEKGSTFIIRLPQVSRTVRRSENDDIET